MHPALTLQPIGHICAPKQLKFQARHQPAEADEESSVLELLPGHDYEQALADLAGFDRIWLIWWFHRNSNWRPLVLPPRGPAQRRGVFSTRSPYRPNPLGITPIRLLRVEKRRLILGPCDLVDGTPVFDIKPYVAAFDAFPDARAGWIDEVDAALAQPGRFTVELSPLANTQAEWLRTHWDIDFIPRMLELLSRDPSPHRTRRIKRRSPELWTIGCGAWRAVFGLRDETVQVRALETGYPMRFLLRENYEQVPDREAQLAFLALWPDQPGATLPE